MDLDDDELRATKERLGNVREYRIVYTKDDNRYYVKAIYVGGTPSISITPTLNKDESAYFDRETAERYVELLEEVYADAGYVFSIEEE